MRGLRQLISRSGTTSCLEKADVQDDELRWVDPLMLENVRRILEPRRHL